MRHRVRKSKLGRNKAHREAMLRNLVTDLFRHERITTTEARAKAVQPMAERLITLARKARADSSYALHARRQALAVLRDKGVAARLFEEQVDSYIDRPGGYTRIVRIGPRRGDAAEMVLLELVD